MQLDSLHSRCKGVAAACAIAATPLHSHALLRQTWYVDAQLTTRVSP